MLPMAAPPTVSSSSWCMPARVQRPLADGESVRATVRPATARDAHDTTGAGDAFAAGILPALQRGDALEAALAEGHRCAARTLDAPGASVGAVVR